MVCELEACEHCRRRCLLIHRKKDNGPDTALTSFFKIMVADEFLKVLFLPPNFACTVSALVDQKINLEDSIGQGWEVTLSNLNGDLAFREGWHEFSLDHGLEIGDFVAFHHIKGSHFVVRIYTRSGCENLDFPWVKNNRKKGKRCSGDSVGKDGSCHIVDKCSIGKKGSNSAAASRSNVAIEKSRCNVNNEEEVPISEQNSSNCENSKPRPQSMANASVEELICMVDRGLGYKGDSRDTLLNLSNFEMCKNNACSGRDEKAGIEDVRLHHADVSRKSQTEADLAGNGSVAEDVVGRVVPLETSDVEMLEWNNKSEVADNTLGSNKDICDGTDSGNFLTAPVAKPNAPLETSNVEMLEQNSKSEVADNTFRSNGDISSGTDCGNLLTASAAKPNMPLETSDVEMLERNNRSEVADNMFRSNKDICNGMDSGNLLTESVAKPNVPSETSKVEMLERNDRSEVADNTLRSNKDICDDTDSGNLLTESVAKPRIDEYDNQEVLNKKLKAVENLSDVHAGTDELVMPQKEPTPISSRQPIKCKAIRITGIRDFPVAFQMQKSQSGTKMEAVKKEHVNGCENVTQELKGKRVKTVKDNGVEAVLGCENVTRGLQGKGPNISVGKGDEIVDHPVKNNENAAVKIVKIRGTH